MNTPIYDFAKKYGESSPIRMHMPGHKGKSYLGCEALDLTEINGADSLYHADGIIRESEENASSIFGSAITLYSTEGSSLCIRAMLYLTVLYAESKGTKATVLAGRNAHSTFISASALLGIDLSFVSAEGSYLSGCLDGDDFVRALDGMDNKPTAIYVTSPDYLGGIADIESIAKVCRENDILLLVDNAHGAYLKFLSPSMHPIDLGAHVCCDSAHKTLPVLTGGAYLHISSDAPDMFFEQAKNAMALFGSTSPSYLTLQSLDLANAYLANGYREMLAEFIPRVDSLKSHLTSVGYSICNHEPLKLTISAKPYGYTGDALAEELRSRSVESEFSDRDFAVMMLSPSLDADELQSLTDALTSIPRRSPINEPVPAMPRLSRALSPKEALFSSSETLPASQSAGRILASANVICPPAVPLAVCGEVIDDDAVKAFEYYGVTSVRVIKEK